MVKTTAAAEQAPVSIRAEADQLGVTLAPLYAKQESDNARLQAALGRQATASGAGLTEALEQVSAARADLERVTAEIGPLKARRAVLLREIEAQERAARQARIRAASDRLTAAAPGVEESFIAFADALRIFSEAGVEVIGASHPDDRGPVTAALGLHNLRAWAELALNDIGLPHAPAKDLSGNLSSTRPVECAMNVRTAVGL